MAALEAGVDKSAGDDGTTDKAADGADADAVSPAGTIPRDDGTTYGSLGDNARIELAKKASVYVVAWMYVIHELEDAVADCLSGNVLNSDLNPAGEAVAAWDEVRGYAALLLVLLLLLLLLLLILPPNRSPDPPARTLGLGLLRRLPQQQDELRPGREAV